jgi:hypothetical protein
MPFVAGFLLGLLFAAEDRGNIFLQNDGGRLLHYILLQPRRLYSPYK